MHFLSLLTTLLSATSGSAGRYVIADLPARPVTRHAAANGDIGGTVVDSATGTPLAGGEVRILQASSVIATTVTDAFGRYVMHNLPAGAYRVEVRYLGYRAQTHDVSIGGADAVSRAHLQLLPLPLTLSPGRGGPGRHPRRRTPPRHPHLH